MLFNLYTGQNHPTDDLSFGRLVLGKKPDILNKTQKTFNDIKPLSPNGIIEATFALGEYALTYRNYLPDNVWKTPPNIIEATITRGAPGEVPRKVIIFNVGGIIFYTNQLDNKDKILLLGVIRPENLRERVRPLLISSNYTSLNPLARSRGLIDMASNPSLTQINTVLLVSLITTSIATTKLGFI